MVILRMNGGNYSRPARPPYQHQLCAPAPRIPAISDALPNHIDAKSDELTHMESYSCAKPRGEGVCKLRRRHAVARHSVTRLATIPFRINTSTNPQICIKTKDFKIIRMNTYKIE
jgi:hypothetical protein